MLLDCQDALETCLAFLDIEELCAAKAVCSTFAYTARVLLRSVTYRGTHMRLHEILEAPWSARSSRAAIVSRLVVLPEGELLRADGPSRLPPLHAAVQRHAPAPVIEVLATALGGAAARRRVHGQLPVHLAAEIGSATALSVLLGASPEDARQRDADGKLPLHHAAARAQGDGSADSTAVVALLLSAHRASAAEWDLNGMLPLHVACLHRAPVALVEALLRAYPEGAEHESAHHGAGHESLDGWIPLHLALISQSSRAVVSALLAAHPESASKRSDSFGCVALHFACKHCAGAPRIIDDLLAAYPDACRLADADGRLPLHLAAAHQPEECTIAALLDALPDATAIADVDDNLPLHCAAASHASAAVVRRLASAFPSALHIAGPGGCLPVHLAVRNGAPLDTLLSLLQAAPSAVTRRADNGALPLHEAIERGASAAIIDALLYYDAQAARSRARCGRLPLELLARRGLLVCDAVDVSTRRSTRGCCGGSGGGSGGHAGGDAGACTHRAVVSAPHGACTHRAEEVINRALERWSVVRATLGRLYQYASPSASQHSLSSMELQSGPDGRGRGRRRTNW